MLTKQETKQTITSLELVEQINLFRKEEGKEKELQHKSLLSIIRDEFEEEIDRQNILPISYKDQLNRDQPMFVLTLSQAKQVLVRESKFVRKHVIAYLEQLEEALKTVMSDKDKLLLNIIKSASELELASNLNKYEVAYVKPLEIRAEKAEEMVEHKTQVISHLTDNIKLQTKRQFLNEIIRMKGNKNGLISDRWGLLYKFYEKQTKMNLSARLEAYNLVNKPKLSSKLELIDKVLNDMDTLYAVAVKTFESDFKSKLQKYLDLL